MAPIPLAADITRRNKYVNVTFGGADTLQEPQRAVEELDHHCTASGFKLQKWTTNYPVVLFNVASERRETTPALVLIDEPTLNTLGIAWRSTIDPIEFSGI